MPLSPEARRNIEQIEQSLALLRRHLDWDNALLRLSELNSLSESPTLWDKPEAAQKLLQERNALEKAIADVRTLERGITDNAELIELADAEGDAAVAAEAEAALAGLGKIARARQLETMLSGEADKNDCYIDINAGAGGTEAQDWAEMLLRMYLRWAEQHGYKLAELDRTDGDGAGIKSATIQVSGLNAYGWLKSEAGVHRLVRISPFDSNAKRHTSFSSVWVYPVIDDSIEITVDEKDLRIDTYRAQGAGGQHVNKTESAVRFTHIPTGIVVACQVDRSQHRNRATAMQMLKAKLYEAELKKRELAANATEAGKTDIGWGHQIRSYVLHPYQMVKDLRTEVETSQSQAVLDGDIDMFLEASLAAKLAG
ncbi:MAG: peptide chain release factor 2 [Alphaproteobacteria bacterium]|nr:peptide chain release factor 2 [Alphaproteobacteria bacterium]